MIYETYDIAYKGEEYKVWRDMAGLDIAPANDELWNKIYDIYEKQGLARAIQSIKNEQGEAQSVITIDQEFTLIRDSLIRWQDGEEKLVRFALIPQNWVDKDLGDHPLDESIFYWLSAYEWISFGVGSQEDNWVVIG